MHANSLTVTDHGLAMRVLLPSLQCALKNIFPEFYLNNNYCTITEIYQAQSYHKWFETIINLLVKVGKRYFGI